MNCASLSLHLALTGQLAWLFKADGGVHAEACRELRPPRGVRYEWNNGGLPTMGGVPVYGEMPSDT